MRYTVHFDIVSIIFVKDSISFICYVAPKVWNDDPSRPFTFWTQNSIGLDSVVDYYCVKFHVLLIRGFRFIMLTYSPTHPHTYIPTHTSWHSDRNIGVRLDNANSVKHYTMWEAEKNQTDW